MLHISKLIAQGAGLAPVLVKRASTIEIDWDIRQKSRFEVTDSLGRQLCVFLPRGTLVRGGDVLVAEDGSMVRVLSAPQSVLRITACAVHGTPFDLTRAAYHLGNRHVPIELKPDHLKIEADHVLAGMLRAMHLTVQEVEDVFEPEGGAYGAGSHGHSHEDGHANVPAASSPLAATVPPASHVHGPDCRHEHDLPTEMAKPVSIKIHRRAPHSH